MAETAAVQDDSVLFKTRIFGLDLEYTKTDAAIDVGLVAAGTVVPGAGNAAMAGVAVVRSGAMMLGRGILKAVFKSAAKEGTEVVAKAAAKETAELAAKAGVKTGSRGASEDALAALAKAKAAGEAERAGVKAVAKEATETAAETGTKAGAKAAKEVTEETVEKTSGRLASATKAVASAAGTGLSYAWTGAKVVSFPFRHPILTAGTLGVGHVATGGASSELLWDGAIGTWNLTKEYAPAAAGAVVDAGLTVGDGVAGFFATGAKKGVAEIGEHLPVGTPASLRAVVAGAETKIEGVRNGDTAQALRDRVAGARDAAEDAADGMDGADFGPFREMLGQHMGIDASKVDGKKIVSVLAEKAKQNPEIALGMAFGAMMGMSNSRNKAEALWKVPFYTAIMGVAFMLLGPILKPLMGLAGQGLNELKDKFHTAQVAPYANGALPSAAEPQKAAPAVDAANDGSKPAASAPAVSAFRDNGLMMTAQADIRKAGINPAIPAANRDQYALAMNG
ncbi:MAG: hypothetical protein NDJ24_03335 [Alphaproteobacteria bacterium]|nr:hypothetical protein [Alphaproteobacteria bacterium]